MFMRFYDKIKPILLICFIALFFACAKQVAITGGPADSTPPVMKKSDPENGSVNFKEKVIYIQFDEYVKFNSLSQKLIISPPIEDAPNIVIKGKGVKISLKPNLLQPNTTYCFNFNDAIADNNENNALNSFVYAFSTGDLIDSLSFSGIVLDAFTKKPVAEVWVLLYDNMVDTAVSTISPSYITKVDKNGNFLIPFVHEKDYHIFAVKDNNYNYLFDIPDEGIAFLDTVYRPSIKVAGTDSLGKKYINVPNDIQLLLFKENKQSQYIKSSKRLSPNLLEVVFNSPQLTEFKIDIVGDADAVIFPSQNKDTVKVWLKNEDLISSDLINTTCFYVDPIFQDSSRTDSLIFRRPASILRDSVANIYYNKTKEPHKKFFIQIQNPVLTYDNSKISVFLKSDTSYLQMPVDFLGNPENPMQIEVKTKLLEKSDYRIILQEGFITDIYGNKNVYDTLKISTTSSSEYGNLTISLVNGGNYIIQLLSGDKVILESIEENDIASFDYIKPGKYIIRAIEDLNNNGRWDTGDYTIKKQPEPVFYLPGEYEIRSNWNHEIEWNPVTNVSK